MAASVTNLVDSVLKTLKTATAKPENFLGIQDAASEKFKIITKSLYDSNHAHNQTVNLSVGLPELYVEGFEEEQIWQQLELYNEPVFNHLMENIPKIISKGTRLTFRATHTLKKSEDEVGLEEEEEDDHVDDGASDSSQSSLEIPSDLNEDDEDGTDDDGDLDELKMDEFKVLDDDYVDKPAKKHVQSRPKKHPKTPVDDQFFKLREMEDFLVKEEQREVQDQPEDDENFIDYFENIPSEEEDEDNGKLAKYSNFFDVEAEEGGTRRVPDPEGSDEELDDIGAEVEDDQDDECDDDEPQGKRVKFNMEQESSEENYEEVDSEAEENDEEEDSEAEEKKEAPKSAYELRQERLKSKIAELEEEAIQPKDWQMLGETKASLRPENALLEEDLVFDQQTRQAPVITEETTRTLEDIIRQRIKDQAFDDVVRKIKPVTDPAEFKQRLVLNQEKSKFSLAEIYEQEFLKQQEQQQQQQQVSSLADRIEDKTANDAAHLKIRKMMDDLFAKLDALSNFHYTPRMPAPEIKIVSNMPSITMEEIAPVFVSDANLLAPEEVQDHVRGEVKSKDEKEKTDRLRERRKKKLLQGKREKERKQLEKTVDAANPGLGNKHAKERTLRQLQQAEKDGTITVIKDDAAKSLKSSTAFFAKLQEEVTSQVSTVQGKNVRPKKNVKRLTGNKLKL